MMALHPQVEGLLAQMAADGAPPISSLTIVEARAMPANLVALGGDPPAVASVRDVSMPVDGGSISLRVYTPLGDGPHPVTVFFHGGGWVIGDLDSHDPLCRDLCAGSSSVVVAVDYRMAPEHRFPVAPNDCFAAVRWVADHADELGVDADRLAVCGDSAGGNLSAVVTQMARQAGGPSIAFAALIYPATDMTDESGSIVENGSGYFLEKNDMDWFMGHYLTAEQRHDPLASPALAADLAGLPAAFVAVCEYDPLRDQGIAYAEKLEAAGVTTELKVYAGLIHAAANMPAVLDGGRELVDDVADRLGTALRR
jgi:acetyl esterase